MVSVTTEAKDLLQNLLQQAGQQSGGLEEGVAIRLAPTEVAENGQVGLGLLLDRAQEGDEVVEHNGQTVLVVDQSTSDMLEGVTLDAADTPNGRQLTINQQ